MTVIDVWEQAVYNDLDIAYLGHLNFTGGQNPTASFLGQLSLILIGGEGDGGRGKD